MLLQTVTQAREATAQAEQHTAAQAHSYAAQCHLKYETAQDKMRQEEHAMHNALEQRAGEMQRFQEQLADAEVIRDAQTKGLGLGDGQSRSSHPRLPATVPSPATILHKASTQTIPLIGSGEDQAVISHSCPPPEPGVISHETFHSAGVLSTQPSVHRMPSLF